MDTFKCICFCGQDVSEDAHDISHLDKILTDEEYDNINELYGALNVLEFTIDKKLIHVGIKKDLEKFMFMGNRRV